jgi:diguanylate cyclase (GGDEF)-like protein
MEKVPVSYQLPDRRQQPARLIAAYDTPRRTLLERGVSLRGAPDLAGFRRYLVARQRAEEMAAAEEAMSSGVKVRRRRLLRRRTGAEVADPQLRPVTWAVSLRGDRRDLEDAFAHRGQKAHAFVVNGPSDAAAVCGFKPRTQRVAGGVRLAQLTPASLESNQHCRSCLVLLYEAALSGRLETGPWPAAEAGHADTEAGQEETEAGQARTDESAQLEADASAGAQVAPLHAAETVGTEAPPAQDDEPAYGEDVAEEVPQQEALAVAEQATEYASSAQADPEAEALSEAQPEERAEARADADEAAPEGPVVIPIGEDWDADHEDLHAAAAEVQIQVEELQGYPLSIVDQAADPLTALLEQGVEDVLVVASAGQTALIVGGLGRGADWAGTLLDMEQEPVLQRAWASADLVHQDGPEVQRIFGPFWAAAAVLVPVGETVCVVFGSARPLQIADEMLFDGARLAAERYQRPSMENVLADEREVSIALKRMLDAPDTSFEAALEHVLTTTAGVLGCSIAAGVARMGRLLEMRAIDLDGADHLDPAQLLGSGPLLTGEQRISVEESVEESLEPDTHLPAVVSRLRLPLSGENVQGLLVLTHTAHRPRGFTTQDHRLAEAMAPAAALVLERAAFGEGMRALEDHVRSAPSTDPLTGLPNQAAWEEALNTEADRLARSGGTAAVAAFRIDGLRRIDERKGPLARDAALREAAELVRRVSRSTDVAARVSEDEFRVLVRDGGRLGARKLATRVRRAAREAQGSDSAMPALTISFANARSRPQLLAASRLVGQRLRSKARAEQPRIGSGRPG